MKYEVGASSLQGYVEVPSSKSHTMRALLFASIADGTSTIREYLSSPDTDAMIEACTQLGAKVIKGHDVVTVYGTDGSLAVPEQVINVGNSGQVLRFIAAMVALIPQYTVITGDYSIRKIRPIAPLLEALTQAGVFAVSSKGDGYAPIIIKGPIKASKMVLDGMDSQPVSALLMMAGLLNGKSVIEVRNPGEKPWIELTLYWLKRMGVTYKSVNYEYYEVDGPVKFKSFEYRVPGDWSSAAFPIVAALITNSEVTVGNIDFDDPQGDKAIVNALIGMGANFICDEPNNKLKILKHNGLMGSIIDVNNMIDAIPILTVAACFAKGETRIIGGEIARHKECDRIAAIVSEMRKIGADIVEMVDGLIIRPSKLYGCTVESHDDHRIAMALAVAGIGIGNVNVLHTSCVAKSYYNFVESMCSLGGNIRNSL